MGRAAMLGLGPLGRTVSHVSGMDPPPSAGALEGIRTPDPQIRSLFLSLCFLIRLNAATLSPSNKLLNSRAISEPSGPWRSSTLVTFVTYFPRLNPD